jgi:hypothetical protein
MPKRAVLGLAIVLGVAVLAAGIYLLTTGLPGSGGQLAELDANQQKWESRNVSHYTMKVNLICFCPWGSSMPWMVEVMNREVISVTDNSGQPVPEDDPIWTVDNSDLLTVDGLFAYVRRAIEEADDTNVEYQPDLGYPVTVGVDWIEQAMDDEMGVHISELHAMP